MGGERQQRIVGVKLVIVSVNMMFELRRKKRCMTIWISYRVSALLSNHISISIRLNSYERKFSSENIEFELLMAF